MAEGYAAAQYIDGLNPQIAALKDQVLNLKGDLARAQLQLTALAAENGVLKYSRRSAVISHLPEVFK